MIGLIVLILPLFLGGGLAYFLGRRARRLGRQASERGYTKRRLVCQTLGETFATIAGVSIVLAFLFADFADAYDGDASPEQFLGYVKMQAILLSLLTIPTALLGLKDGTGDST